MSNKSYRYRSIGTHWWGHGDFQKLSIKAKYFFIYLSSNHLTTQCGCYMITDKTIASESDFTLDELKPLFEELSDAGYFTVERRQDWVWVYNFTHEQDFSTSENFLVGIFNSINEIEDDKLREDITNFNEPLRKILEQKRADRGSKGRPGTKENYGSRR